MDTIKIKDPEKWKVAKIENEKIDDHKLTVKKIKPNTDLLNKDLNYLSTPLRSKLF